MKNLLRLLFALLSVAFAGLAILVVTGTRPSPAEAPRERPPSVEDEIRELKRRCDKLEAERAELQEKAKEATGQLEKDRKEIEQARNEIKKANDRIDTAVAQAGFHRVPIGAMLPYFGDGNIPPKGYIWADGKGTWPDVPWRPAHLKDKKVPDMSGLLIGGTADLAKVGVPWTDGKLGLTITVKGNNFSLPPTKQGKSPGAFWALSTGPGELGNPRGTLRLAKRTTTGGTVYTGAKLDSVRVAHPAPQVFIDGVIRGKVQVSPSIQLNKPNTLPQHLRCRWIIRIE